MTLLHFFVVKLTSDGSKRRTELGLRFRASDSSVDFAGSEPILSSFCFPLGPESVPAKEYMASEEYTFTLTHGDGTRFQGFCRKGLPPPPKVGSRLRYPHVLCIISEYPWCNFYFKVLQILEQLLRSGGVTLDSGSRELPVDSQAGTFLQELGRQLSTEPSPGQVIRVPLPKHAGLLGVSPPRSFLPSSQSDSLSWSEDLIELQVPPDCGNGKWNCGISLARLLWHVPVSAMLTLIASLLLERRIIIVGQSWDTVTAAVQAATALLYPFRWHHIYLPLLPKQLRDYLSAPMPFMVGMPAQMLPALKGLSMDEVTIVDLDLGKCDPAPGSLRDDSQFLPWRDRLEAALTAAYGNLRSPTEYESSPLIAGIMQAYFMKLIGNYRRYIHEDTPALNALHAQASPRSSPSGGSSSGSNPGSHHRKDSDVKEDNALKGHGQAFEHEAFTLSHRQNEKARRFLSMFRHSQMYEVFIQERLQMSTQGFQTDDAFEANLVRYQDAKKLRLAQRLSSQPHVQNQASKWSAMLKKHRRTGSGEAAAAWSKDSVMRRITTDPRQLTEQGDGSSSVRPLDPASFFEDDDDFMDEPEFALPRFERLGAVYSSNPRDLRIHSEAVGFGRTALAAAAHALPGHGSTSVSARSNLTAAAAAAAAVATVAAAAAGPAGPTRSVRSVSHGPQDLIVTASAFAAGPAHHPPEAEVSPDRTSLPASLLGSPGLGGSLPAGAGSTPKKDGGLVLSWTSGSRHYEGNLSSVVRDIWSKVKGKGVGGEPAALSAEDVDSCLDDSAAMQPASQLHNSYSHGTGVEWQRDAGPASSSGGGGSSLYRRQVSLEAKDRPKQGIAGNRFAPHGGGGGGAAAAHIGSHSTPSLLDGVDGGFVKLRQPPAPTRPLHMLKDPNAHYMPSMTSLAEQVSPSSTEASRPGHAAAAATSPPSPPIGMGQWDPFGLTGGPASATAATASASANVHKASDGFGGLKLS